MDARPNSAPNEVSSAPEEEIRICPPIWTSCVLPLQSKDGDHDGHEFQTPANTPDDTEPRGSVPAVADTGLHAGHWGLRKQPAPSAQLAMSKWAVDSASAAGGDDAAPADMRMARDKLSQANAAMAAENHDVARWLAQEAEVDAQLAGVKARRGGASKARAEPRHANRTLPEVVDLKLLDQARSDVRLAQGNPLTTEWAGAELQRSLDALARANDAFARSDSQAEVDHWAYMAKQRAAIALEITRQKSAEKVVS